MKSQSLLFLIFLFISTEIQARITKIVIDKTESYANGKTFGAIGQYEKLTGRAFGEVNPNDSHNAIIQDIQLAPRNAKGLVEYEADFILLKPVNTPLSNGLLFYNVPNRGNAFPADETLLKRGYIYLWSGWQGDLFGEGKVKIKVPIATENGKEITGLLRTQIIVNQLSKTEYLSSGVFSSQNHLAYPTVTLDNKDCILTKRIHAEDPSVKVPNADWAFADCTKQDFPGVASPTQISLKGGFDPNYIYDLTYTAKNPLVLGLGFAAVRDIVAFFRHAEKDDFNNANVLAHQIKVSMAYGVSQCGNFLRTFLSLGFNQDETNKPVFEGMNVHIGTRKTTLNVRFGRPGGGGGQHEDILFAGNEPPFLWSKTLEPLSNTEGGILDACEKQGFVPKIIHTLSSNEYWMSRMSLRTTDVFGKKDVKIPKNVRIYLFSSTQHGPSQSTAVNKITGFPENPNSFYDPLRVLHIALENWIFNGTKPPKSQYPTVKKHTLVAPDKASIGWHDIPNVPYTGLVNGLTVRDFGTAFDEKMMSGILTEPPIVYADKKYTVLVPKVNEDDNEIGGVHTLTWRVPLGTYTGWSLRKAGYSEGDLAGLSGEFIPFKKTKTERLAVGDPRLSLEERYGSQEGYINAVKKAAAAMIKEGFLLPEDAEREIEKAKKANIF